VLDLRANLLPSCILVNVEIWYNTACGFHKHPEDHKESSEIHFSTTVVPYLTEVSIASTRNIPCARYSGKELAREAVRSFKGRSYVDFLLTISPF